MKKSVKFIAVIYTIVAFSSCTTINRSMREPNAIIELNMDDFELSPQLAAEATTTKIFFIDFERLFTKKTGVAGASFSVANVPIIGNFLSGFVMDQTTSYAMYNLLKNNPGYDVIFYPQIEKKRVRPLATPLISITTVEVTARLGKLKSKQ